MRVWIASLVFLSLACSKGPAHKTERASTRASANGAGATTGAVTAPEPGAAAPAAAVTLTPDKVKGYVRYMEQFSTLWKKSRVEARKGASAGRDAASAEPTPAQAAALQKQLLAVREEVGLTQPELDTLQNLFTLVQANRTIKPATMDEKIAEFEQQLGSLPASERGEAVRQVAEMRSFRDNIVDMRDARAAYGDAVVDAMLAAWPQLSGFVEGL